ncbi:hypothetical protein [Kribbella sindirgiensis]|uniref:Uncharacterized protein n=1 Tax=Kribbella sindirgiensis TaxID=1124744 RepID=A0A4R0J407_9ACTN|nr:hypothetical protein [Kribbella sindirgiensis]TCC39874.1 hypothetical protein E0H50_08175 [Kribbella sindirgiensis]
MTKKLRVVGERPDLGRITCRIGWKILPNPASRGLFAPAYEPDDLNAKPATTNNPVVAGFGGQADPRLTAEAGKHPESLLYLIFLLCSSS